jgi:HlyD family secretion protein
MKKAIWFAIPVGVIAGAWLIFGRGGSDEMEVEYRFAPAEKGTVTRSISATGLTVALTTVDVKSKAGGKVVRLAVDEGSVVKKGDLIAVIDPEDTQAVFQQASADLRAAEARANQAQQNYQLQLATSQSNVRDAQAALDAAKSRLTRMRIENEREPTLAKAQLNSAQASYDSANEALRKYDLVTVPQLKRDAQGSLDRSKSSYEAAQANLRRQRELLALGFSSPANVEQAEAQFRGAEAEYRIAQQRFETLDRDIEASRTSLKASLTQALASLNQAKANQSNVGISAQDLRQAEIAVQQAEIALQRAKDNVRNNVIRQQEFEAAKASTTRSRVSVDNAKVQLDSTTVVAPRDGVVTLKYLEEGTIIPPGTSTFSQGTSLVQLSDVTTLFVECAVDEADISAVKEGQRVRIITEAYPGQPLDGTVDRISPAAITANNITAVKVRVKVLPGAKVAVLPGMNATCEFITLEKKDVLMIPAQAIQREDGKSFVRVKSKDPKKPERREVELGESGNDGVEVLKGLSEGEEIVIAEINLAEMREIQERMMAAQEGGGLAGGNTRMGTSRATGAGGGAGGGASRGAGGR